MLAQASGDLAPRRFQVLVIEHLELLAGHQRRKFCAACSANIAACMSSYHGYIEEIGGDY
jgi:hypothetical protein